MRRRSFGSLEYEHKKVKTRRQKFLERMDTLVPWEELEKRIAPVYPKPGRGRRPYPLRVMLRIHCLQLWVQPQRPRHGAGALRLPLDARVHGPQPLRADSRWDDHPPFPAPAGASSAGNGALCDHQRTPRSAGPAGARGDDRGLHRWSEGTHVAAVDGPRIVIQRGSRSRPALFTRLPIAVPLAPFRVSRQLTSLSPELVLLLHCASAGLDRRPLRRRPG